MPWWDFLGGGDGGGDPLNFDFSNIGDAGNIDPGISDFLASTQPFNFDNLSNTLSNVGGTISDIGSNFGNFTIPGAIDLSTIDWAGPNTNIFGGTGPAGVTDTTGIVNSIFNNPVTKPLVNAGVTSVLGPGGGGGATPGATTPPGTPGTPGGSNPAAANPQGPRAPGGGAPQTSGGGGGLPGIIKQITGGGGNFADILASAGLLGGLLKKDHLPPQADALQKQADQLGQIASGQVLPTALANQQGMINDQALGRVERSLRQQQASIRKSYADMGMSGSTMEAQDLNNASQAADQEVFSVGQQMATSGLQTAMSMFGDQSNIMQSLMQAQIDQDKELSDAMAQFAAAAVRYDGSSNTPSSGGGGGTGGGTPLIPGAAPGSTPQDIVNQVLGITSNPIDPGVLGGPITPLNPLTVQPDPSLTPNDLINPVNPDPSQFIPGLDSLTLGEPGNYVSSGTI